MVDWMSGDAAEGLGFKPGRSRSLHGFGLLSRRELERVLRHAPGSGMSDAEHPQWCATA